MLNKIKEAKSFIESKTKLKPSLGVVLGSGLGDFVNRVENKVTLPYNIIPHFKTTTVEGHEGALILGEVKGKAVAVLQGRIHAYEGHALHEVVFPLRVLIALGIKNVVLTNAAGGIHESFRPGDLVLIKDHINLTGMNPLIGPNIPEFGPRFPDMTYAYDPELRMVIEKKAQALGIELKSGVYAGLSGPTYETPAEIRMLRTLGADMVGMSTVPECIVANHQGIKVIGISCITNLAAGLSKQKLHHGEIKEQALKVMRSFTTLLEEVTPAL